MSLETETVPVPDTSSVSDDAEPAFKRVLLKLSGEALMGDGAFGVSPTQVGLVADQIARVVNRGVEVAIVVGAGNFFRGVSDSAAGMERATADYMGMIATSLNALPIQDALEKRNIPTRIMSAIELQEVAEPYIRRRALRHLEKGRVVIFAAGTGNPYFTTDTAAALRALEIGADAILMAKNGVEGVYDRDPKIDPAAEFLPELSHADAVERKLRVMDQTALTLCGENHLNIHVFNMDGVDNIERLVTGERLGTIVHTPREDEQA